MWIPQRGSFLFPAVDQNTNEPNNAMILRTMRAFLSPIFFYFEDSSIVICACGPIIARYSSRAPSIGNQQKFM